MEATEGRARPLRSHILGTTNVVPAPDSTGTRTSAKSKVARSQASGRTAPIGSGAGASQWVPSKGLSPETEPDRSNSHLGET
ncbi:hypothetical protein Aglo03_39950 [Actinokineospora globicatena]|uniref:Uncharacterized protein n=1 Tax=Actinokineospora globicatena TaxID=103729 RepID=A0A9W6QR79_9PSEU|nr:hypothetical protein Aglo03_39950 [Actinokineospora globicatena]